MKQIILAFLIFTSISIKCQTYKTIVDTSMVTSVTNLDIINYDLNFDGLTDVTFQYLNTSESFVMVAHVGSYLNNYVLCPGYIDVTVLNNGDSIGPASVGWRNENSNFDPSGFFFNARIFYRFWGGGNINGNFANLSNKFIGVKFLDTNGDTLYGYIEVTNNVDSPPGYFKIHSFGYNSVPNTAVIAGSGNLTALTYNTKPNDYFRVYPTLVEDYLLIEPTENVRNNYNINIVNLSGSIVLRYDSKKINSIERLDLTSLDKGVYFLFFQNKNNTFCEKIIKL